ncbi:MAG: response regulator [Chitinophagales bacterium]
MANAAFHVLIADDDIDDHTLYRYAMKEVVPEGLLEIVADGTQLMRKLMDATIPPPDIILLDLNMPLMNGLECLIQIRKTASLKHLPVIIFSTSDHENDIAATFEQGANLYVKKPGNFSGLTDIFANLFHRSSTELRSRPARDRYLFSI